MSSWNEFVQEPVILQLNKKFLVCYESRDSLPYSQGPAPINYTLFFKVYLVGSKSFRPDQLSKVTEIKQLCYFST